MVNPHLSQSLVIPTSMNDPNITLLTSYVQSYPNHIHYYIRRFPKIGVSQNHPCFGESASINVYYLRIYLGIPHLWKPPSQPEKNRWRWEIPSTARCRRPHLAWDAVASCRCSPPNVSVSSPRPAEIFFSTEKRGYHGDVKGISWGYITYTANTLSWISHNWHQTNRLVGI